MEQMITNIWNINALLGGIVVFLILLLLIIMAFLGLCGTIFNTIKRRNKD